MQRPRAIWTPSRSLQFERIEVLRAESLGVHAGHAAVRGAFNLVLRKDLDGFDVRTVARIPSRNGGEARQGSVVWGGTIGNGRAHDHRHRHPRPRGNRRPDPHTQPLKVDRGWKFRGGAKRERRRQHRLCLRYEFARAESRGTRRMRPIAGLHWPAQQPARDRTQVTRAAVSPTATSGGTARATTRGM